MNRCYEEGKTNGMQWEDVVGWYLEKKEDDLQTEEDLNAEEAIVNKVGYLCGFV